MYSNTAIGCIYLTALYQLQEFVSNERMITMSIEYVRKKRDVVVE